MHCSSMEKLTWTDHRKISTFARELYSLGSVTAISEQIVNKLDTLVGGNSVLIARMDPQAVPSRLPADSVSRQLSYDILAHNVGPELNKLGPVVSALRHEHPGIRYHLAHPSRPAVAIADLLPLNRWKRTAIFNEVFSRLGMGEQLGVGAPLTRSEYLAVVVNRTRRTFTERDRSVLNILRTHISEACRGANLYVVATAASIMEALEPLVGEGIVVLDATGRLLFCSDLAQKHFESYFATEKPFHGGLPLTVEKWSRREITAFRSVQLATHPPRSLTIRRGERTLRIRIGSTRDKTVHLLLLRAEDPAVELEKLSYFELGPRATEVLYWLAKGKTNEEIGIILGVATATVKVHLRKIYFRLNVENRATAASMISELLVRCGY
jgi:DNA-binding CsgD family transcriptional regulator